MAIGNKKYLKLRPFSDRFYEMVDMVQKMSAKDREALIREADSLTPTNCGWAMYRIAPLIKKLCQEEPLVDKLQKHIFPNT